VRRVEADEPVQRAGVALLGERDELGQDAGEREREGAEQGEEKRGSGTAQHPAAR
jgi:hypothetical protein